MLAIHKKAKQLQVKRISDILNAISDEKILAIFKVVGDKNSSSSGPMHISKMKLTRKQYYSRLEKLIKADLIKRKDGNYSLTSFGKVVYEAQMKIENAINNYHWKLRVIDVIDGFSSSYADFEEERNKIIDTLIDNQKIKEIIA